MVTAILAACPPWRRPYFTVAFWTGARQNELAAFKWGDADAARGIFRIRARRYRGHEGPPKTASSVRDIDLLPAVVDALKAQKAQQAAEASHVAVAHPRRGRTTSSPDRKGAWWSEPAGAAVLPKYSR